MRIAITGATGLIGRNLLFEAIKQNLNSLDDLEILILGRSKDNYDVQKRIKKIIIDDGLSYLSAAKEDRDKVIKYCDIGIKGINVDLDKEKLGLASDDLKELNKDPIDIFFHIAAMTDLRDTPAIEKALERTNIFGTQQILHLVSALKKVREFCYVGTAYSCGKSDGVMKPDYIDVRHGFRNSYERTKLEAEIIVRNFAKKTKTRCRYFRPSVTCGRLIEPPLGSVSKFDVFYGWAAFLFQMKLKHLKKASIDFKKALDLDMKIYYSLKSGLNIVPADYIAKVMYQVCVRRDPGDSYYLVNNQETPHSLYIPLTFSILNIEGLKHVDKLPDNMNRIEKLYYKTAGKVFTPYVTSKPMLFDTTNLGSILKRSQLRCPAVDEKTFPILIDFAVKQNFGLEIGA